MNKLKISTQRWVSSFLLIFTSVLVCSFVPTLVSKKIVNGQITILLPVNFELMDNATRLIKYPRKGNAPTEVYTNKTASVNVAFNLTQQVLPQKDLLNLQNAIINLIKAVAGSNIISNEVKIVNGKKIATVEFYSKTASGSIYNLMFILSLNEKAMIGSFNRTFKEVPEWKLVAHKIVESIKY